MKQTTSPQRLRLLFGFLIYFISNLCHGQSNTLGRLNQEAPAPITTPNRSIYLNGIDISSARNQDLKNVHIKISEHGDIFISAPQYQVTEDETFLPLSTYTGKSQPPEHRPPQALNSGTPGKSASSLTPPASLTQTETAAPEKTAEKSSEKEPEKTSDKSAETPGDKAPAVGKTALAPNQPASSAPPKAGG